MARLAAALISRYRWHFVGMDICYTRAWPTRSCRTLQTHGRPSLEPCCRIECKGQLACRAYQQVFSATRLVPRDGASKKLGRVKICAPGAVASTVCVIQRMEDVSSICRNRKVGFESRAQICMYTCLVHPSKSITRLWTCCRISHNRGLDKATESSMRCQRGWLAGWLVGSHMAETTSWKLPCYIQERVMMVAVIVDLTFSERQLAAPSRGSHAGRDQDQVKSERVTEQ